LSVVLPVLDAGEIKQTPRSEIAMFASALKQAGFIGEIDISYSGRLIAATDNSIYQQIPQAVVYPKSQNDLTCLLKVAARDSFQGIKFSPRGGGTGTNGQALTSHVVVDLSRHLTHILELNEEEGWVRVEAGVVKDQLNAFLAPYGYFFAPDTSTSNRCTIGGMIATDASGQGSIVYGKTSDHVISLRSFLVSGESFDASEVSYEQARELANGSGPTANIYQQVLATCIGFQTQIREKFPRLNRFLTGYDLEHAIDPEKETVHLGRLIAGAEGTLAFVGEAKLRITPIPKQKILVNIQYTDFESALRHAPALMQAEATSVETIDSNVLNLARNDVIWREVAEWVDTESDDVQMNGINMVEYTAHSEFEITEKLKKLEALLASSQAGVCGYKLCDTAESIQKVYAMRKKAVGLLGATPGKAKPVAFVEDTAVPPEKLADYILEFRALLDARGLKYGMFGHIDAGVLHVRPALDMTTPESAKTVREVSDQVMALTAKYGGLMWGEHGKGYRSEYGPEFFGEQLFDELRKIKAAFDPKNRLNPGKICTPFESDECLVSVDDPKRGDFDRQVSAVSTQHFQGAMECNGNGLCFSFDASTPMCPSYRGTLDRRDSPKGRATLIREWLRQVEKAGYHPERSPIQNSFIKRSLRTLRKRDSFNEEVKAAMDSCLACKACSTQCPVKVDIPTQRAKFYEHYFAHHTRSLKDQLVKNSERMLPKLARYPRLSNFLMHNAVSRWVQKTIIGYVDTPKFATIPIETLLKQSQGQWITLETLEEHAQRSDFIGDAYVALVQDVFTSCFEPQLLADFIKVAQRFGITPVILPFAENGKGLHVKGFLSEFREVAHKQSQSLQKVAALGVPLVGLDAATTLCYRDEYVKELGNTRGNYQVLLIQEWLKNFSFEALRTVQSSTSTEVSLLTHCTEQTQVASSSRDWQEILAMVGIQVRPATTGCCGMAGSYGHEVTHLNTSQKIFSLSWQPLLAKATGEVAATGFSCRCQTKRFAQRTVSHPLSLLAQQLT